MEQHSYPERSFKILLNVLHYYKLIAFALLQTYCLCLPTNWQGHLALLPHWSKIQTVQAPHSSAPIPIPLTKPKTPFRCPRAPAHPWAHSPALHQVIAWLHLLCIMTSISISNQLLCLKIMWRGFWGFCFELWWSVSVQLAPSGYWVRIWIRQQEAIPCIAQNHDLPQFTGATSQPASEWGLYTNPKFSSSSPHNFFLTHIPLPLPGPSSLTG